MTGVYGRSWFPVVMAPLRHQTRELRRTSGCGSRSPRTRLHRPCTTRRFNSDSRHRATAGARVRRAGSRLAATGGHTVRMFGRRRARSDHDCAYAAERPVAQCGCGRDVHEARSHTRLPAAWQPPISPPVESGLDAANPLQRCSSHSGWCRLSVSPRPASTVRRRALTSGAQRDISASRNRLRPISV
jgi:hypothetical protein